jgi:polyisoprenoid-binding protein YceI
MRGLSLLAAAGLACWSPAAEAAPARYTIDPEHTSIAFMVSHIGYHNLLGQFLTGGGTFVWDEEGRALSDLEVRIDAASVFTRHQARDEHVRSKDFLDAAAHPAVTFVGRRAEPTGERTGRVTGDLTLRGVTRPVTLDVTWNKSGWYPYLDNYVVGISARTVLRRSEWGMDYAVANGLVGDEVSVIIELEAIREKLPGQEPPPR